MHSVINASSNTIARWALVSKSAEMISPDFLTKDRSNDDLIQSRNGLAHGHANLDGDRFVGDGGQVFFDHVVRAQVVGCDHALDGAAGHGFNESPWPLRRRTGQIDLREMSDWPYELSLRLGAASVVEMVLTKESHNRFLCDGPAN